MIRILSLFLLVASRVVAVDYYVSTLGSDANPGTLAQPFATLDGARTAIRGLSHPLSSPVTIWLRGGRYYVQSAYILIGSQDSGTAANRITYTNYPGETPYIIGGIVVTGFASVTDPAVLARLTASAQTNVQVADLAAQAITNLGTMVAHGYYHWNYENPELPFQSELLCQDSAMTLARWPNALTTNPRTNWAAIAAPNTTNTFGYTGINPINWQQSSNVLVHGFWDYDFGDSWEQVVSIDTNSLVVTLTDLNSYGSQYWGAHPHRQNQRFYWLNILEELDMAGEYYIDRVTTNLYFWPPNTMTNGACVVTTTTNAVLMTGVSNVTFSGLVFEGGKSPLVQMSGGYSNRIDTCTFRGGSAYGVKFLQATNSGITHSAFYDLGEGGVLIYESGHRLTLTSGGNYITYSTFSNLNRLCVCSKNAIQTFGTYYFSVLDMDGLYVGHNLFRNIPSQAISCFGNDNVIEYNEFDRVCTETADAGIIYNGGNPTFYGNVVRYNYFHDSHMTGGAANFTGVLALYWDGGQNSCSVYGNLFANVDHGIFINGGRNHVVMNNIFVDITNAITSKLAPFCVLVNQSCLGNGFTNTTQSYWGRLTNIPFQNALWSTAYPLLSICTNGVYAPNINQCIATNNVIATNICFNYYTNTQSPYYGTSFRWADFGAPVPQSGNSTNSVVVNNLTNADPLFVDYVGRNFNLQTNSPALALGFVPLPLDQIGPGAPPVEPPVVPPVVSRTATVRTVNVGTMRSP